LSNTLAKLDETDDFYYQMDTHLNRLASASSPYLQQHAGNPVDWYEWGEEALEKAANENKPLIISIGYAACHWCHVMAHESFMDGTVAGFMNSHFICIKIDREERPDIDQIYMEAAQHISGGGGWPLNAFAFPDGRPFYAGTYFPKNQWLELLKRIVRIYNDQNTELGHQADSLTGAIRNDPFETSGSGDHAGFSKEQYTRIFLAWQDIIDYHAGGFSAVPKFPLPVAWEFVLQYYYLTGNEKALESVGVTLQAMANGGIYDQVGGGFARYSTDKKWKVPHFEKMLYDNAQLVSLYAHAWQVTRNPAYSAIVEQTVAFVQRELMSPEGGFYSSLDADSEGGEGRFYSWTTKELDEILGPSASRLISDWYQAIPEGNWEEGQNILLAQPARSVFAGKHNLQPEIFSAMLEKANNSLLLAREKRPRPARDEKIITAWNALMITACVDAFKAFGKQLYLETAISAATFLENNMIRDGGNLWRSFRNGKSSVGGFLDDFAFFAEACINLYEVTFDLHWLELGNRLTRYATKHFSAGSGSLFFYTGDLSEPLIARKREVSDNVIPASNSVMARVLFRLGHYHDNDPYITRALQMLRQMEPELAGGGPYYANWATLLGMVVFPYHEVAIAGEMATAKSLELQRNYLPTSMFLGGNTENLSLLENKLVKNKTIIYVCVDKTCSQPVEEVDKALTLITLPRE
jgi:uncharacterized protein YyaL (SSP411 family)